MNINGEECKVSMADTLLSVESGEIQILPNEGLDYPAQIQYILDASKESIEFKERPYLVQRLKFTPQGIQYDYMWSSEFECGTVPRSINAMIDWINKKELVLVEKEGVDILCHPSMLPLVIEQIKLLLTGNARTKESLNIDGGCTDFLSLDNNYFFSTNGNGRNYLKHLKYRELMNLHAQIIKAHPSYIYMRDLCTLFDDELRRKGINITYIGVGIDRIANETFGRNILDTDFDGNHIWINSNRESIYSGWYSKIDIENALYENQSPVFTTTYYFDIGDYVQVAKSNDEKRLSQLLSDDTDIPKEQLSEVIKNIVNNQVLDRGFIDKFIDSRIFNLTSNNTDFYEILVSLVGNIHISEMASDKMKQWAKEIGLVEQFDNNILARKEAIDTLGQKTLEDIKKVFLTGEYIDYNGEVQVGFHQSRQLINLSNNLSRMGFRNKKLNEYVIPEEYKKAYNEILIWNSDHKGAEVYIGDGNYEGIPGYIDLEKITGKKTISNRNIASENIEYYSFSPHHGSGSNIERILKPAIDINKIDLFTIFWCFGYIHDINEGKSFNKEFVDKTVRGDIKITHLKKLIGLSYVETMYNYFDSNFPGELEKNQYKAFAEKFDILFKQLLQELLDYKMELKKSLT